MPPELKIYAEGVEKSGAFPPLSPTRLAAAEYIREIARQLADIAGGARLPVVQCLFQMAYVETHDIIRGARPPDGQSPAEREVD
jgi:hypothetical protein